jgi:exodeoxyribonuclease-1
MDTQETFYWYDLETFGLNARYDRIAQFAGIRTDTALNIIGEPTVLYCRLSDDYLPDPLACLVTGITPQEVQAKGLCESAFIQHINDIFSVPRTTVAGFNSLRFDDEFIRNALFRNFLDPYRREWEKGNSRWDILDLLRAAHDLRPEGIVWPVNAENGNPVFKLTALTEANHIAHDNAHDALSDVKATIALASLILRKQPRLFNYYLKLRKKQTVKELMRIPLGEPVLLTSVMSTRPQGCSTLVVPINTPLENTNSIIVFDLMQDADALYAVPDEEILHVKGISRVALNRCPFVSPMSVLTDSLAERLGIDKQACLATYDRLRNDPMLAVKVRVAADQDEYPKVADVDFSLYNGFFPDSDIRRFEIIRNTAPQELLDLNLRFDDNERCPELLWRYICRNWPEALDAQQSARWKSFCASRLLQAPGDVQVNYEFYQRKIEEKMASKDTTPQEKIILAKLDEWGKGLRQRIFG